MSAPVGVHRTLGGGEVSALEMIMMMIMMTIIWYDYDHHPYCHGEVGPFEMIMMMKTIMMRTIWYDDDGLLSFLTGGGWGTALSKDYDDEDNYDDDHLIW